MADTKISAATLTTPQTTDMIPMERSGSAVARYSTVAAIVQAQAASTAARGSVELATVAETQAGTSATLAVTPAGLLAVSQAVYNVTSYGAAGGSDSTSGIQAAMDAAGAAGGGVVYVPPSADAYLLTVAGTHTGLADHKYCLKFNYDNITLYIDTGATLKLADAQQADGAPVDMIVGVDLAHITITGGGTITGNTAGQTGWSGGYAQVTSGCLIYIWGTNGGGCSHITISDLTLSDHFSNPIEINNYTQYDGSYVRLENLYCSAFGEGPSVGNSRHVYVADVYVNDTANVSVGDGVQVENSKDVVITGIQVKTNGGGAAIEAAGSQQVVISDFVIDGWSTGISIQSTLTLDTTDISVIGGQILNCATVGIEIIEWYATSVSRITLSGCVIRSCATAGIYLAYTNAPITGPVTIVDCEATGCGYGFVSAGAVKDLSIIGGRYDDNTNGGVVYGYGYGTATAADTVGLLITGVSAKDNGAWGIEFADGGTSDRYPTGLVSNCICTGNSTGAYSIGSSCYIENMLPNAITAYSDTTTICGYRYFSPSTGAIKTFLFPSPGQQVIIRFAVDTWHVIDKSQSGGVNIRLVGGVNFVPAVGNRMCLEYNEVDAEWVELWRRIN